jgi:hypothetical protein
MNEVFASPLKNFTPLGFQHVSEAGRLLPKIYFLGKQRKGVKIMQLLTKEITTKLPALYTQENEEDPLVICKFFAVWTKWTWYGIEFDGKDTFFGYVAGDYPELGYFTLSELQELKGPMGLSIERDMYFKPIRLSEIKKLHEPGV